jgi:phosphatidylserine decarboxylase
VGDRVAKGERVGLIKFGSRTDVILGPEWKIVVQPGENVVGGSTVLARRVAPVLAGANNDVFGHTAESQEERE